MSKFGTLIAGVVLMSSFAGALTAADSKIDGDGFVRDWLILAPFSIPEDMGSDEIDTREVLERDGAPPQFQHAGRGIGLAEKWMLRGG